MNSGFCKKSEILKLQFILHEGIQIEMTFIFSAINIADSFEIKYITKKLRHV